MIIISIVLIALTILNIYGSIVYPHYPAGQIGVDTGIYHVNDMEGETVNKPQKRLDT